MRYYRLELSGGSGALNPPSWSGILSGAIGSNTALQSGVITSLMPNGYTNPAALNVELDVTQMVKHFGDARSYIRIYGLGLKDISQAFDLNQANVALYAGMAKGYPLANPNQAGLLVKGYVYQSFGNWLGTDMTLDIVFGPKDGSPNNPMNIHYEWRKGEPLSAMLQRVATEAFPTAQHKITTSDNRVATEDQSGFAGSLAELAAKIQKMTKGKLGDNDDGVYITIDGDDITAFESNGEGSQMSSATINFQDLLGQVTWYEPYSITAKLVMRGDLQISQSIKFPAGLPTTLSAGSMPAFGGASRQSNLLGFGDTDFTITQIQHWGNYRQPDAQSWNTTIWARRSDAPTNGGGNGSSNGGGGAAGSGGAGSGTPNA